MLRSLLLTIVLLTGIKASTQEYNYIRYTIANGLPSNTIYDVTQDKDGFIWIATDAGLVRFDGRNMVTYTMNDGLPSNDVLKLYPDSRGRTWITTIHNSVCYHYQGRIHSYKNDSLLNKIRVHSFPLAYQENNQGDVLIASHNTRPEIYILTYDNKIIHTIAPAQRFSDVTTFRGQEKREFIIVFSDTLSETNRYYSYKGQWKPLLTIRYKTAHDSLFFYRPENDTMKLFKTEQVPPDMKNKIHQYDIWQHKGSWIQASPLPERISGIGRVEWMTWYYGTSNGTFLLDSSGKISDHLLPGTATNRSYRDKEDNIWLCTNSEGLVLLPSRHIKSLRVQNKESFLFSLHKAGNTLLAGSTHGNLLLIRNNKIETINFDQYIRHANNKTQDNRLRSIGAINNKEVLLCFDDFILKYDPVSRKEIFCRVDVTKGMHRISDDSLCVFTGRGALLLDSRNMAVLDTILPVRCFSGVKTKTAWYIGTTNGPVKVVEGKATYLGNTIPELNTLVNKMEIDQDGSIWMSTLGNGIFRLRNDQVVRHINSANGLNSDNCKAMALDEKFIWVGTEKGLNRVDRYNLQAAIMQYAAVDGLPSNDIYSLLSDSGKIYVGTEGYLTWFDSAMVKEKSICQLHLQSIEQGKHAMKSADSLPVFKYNENNLRFTFTALSFRSSNNILHFYRLKGLSDAWDSTRNNNLEFLALPPGGYELEIFARNKFGQNSDTISIPFTISPPFWATWWFRLLTIGLIVAIAWWTILRRIRSEKEKANTRNRINELEQQALRSQMNPHFIFNCLNSIQNFLLQNNFEKTNEYLTAFAHLIRQTLDNSSRSTISIEGEIKYLSSYLELECMRFAYSFEYSIQVDPEIDTEYTHIPTMILQPYLENSIRHGIRYKQGGNKAVKISFLKRGNTLVCIVEDNGVGRKRASELKSFMHVEYQSKGMRLTGDRIEALNRLSDIPITVDVIDLEQAGNATGTQVIVRFPNMFL